MNYESVYNQLIEKRKSNLLPESEYGEVHHIIPRSLGGSDEKSNLVRLSAREHYISHMLLSEMYDEGTDEWYKMQFAFNRMSCNNNLHKRYSNSRFYELKRKDFSKAISCIMKGHDRSKGKKNSQYGTCWIKNFELEESKKIPKEDLQSWLDKGWEKGRCKDFKKAKHATDLKVAREKLRDFLQVPLLPTYIGTFKGHKFTKQAIPGFKTAFGIDISKDFDTAIRQIEALLVKDYVETKTTQTSLASRYGVSRYALMKWLKLFKL